MWSNQHQGVCSPIKNPCQHTSCKLTELSMGEGRYMYLVSCNEEGTISHLMGGPMFHPIDGGWERKYLPTSMCTNSEFSEIWKHYSSLPSAVKTNKRSLRNQEEKVRTHLRSQWEAADCHSASDGNPLQRSFYPCRKTNNSKISCVILVSFVDNGFSAHWLSSTGNYTQTIKDNL